MLTDNYIKMVFEHDLECLREEQQQEVIQMIQESQFITDALESGFIPVDEALTKGSNIIAKSAYDVFMMIVNKLANAFMSAANKKIWSAFGEQGVAKLQENIQTLIDRANALQPRKMTPCWKGKIIKGLDDCTKGIEAGFNNVKNKNIEEHNWIPAFIKDQSLVLERSSDLSPTLKTYFLTGNFKAEKDMRVTVDGATIAKNVKTMVDFMQNYKQNADYIAKEFQDAAKRRPKDQEMNRDTVGAGNTPDQRANDVQNKTNAAASGATESIAYDDYIMIEDCMVCESSLRNTINYNEIITEANGIASSPNAVSPTNNSAGGSNNTQNTATNNTPTQQENPTKVDKVGSPQQDNTEKENKKQQKDENSKRKDYCKSVEYFQRISQSAIQYSFEVKFHVYYTILKEIGKEFITGGDPKKAPKGKNGGKGGSDQQLQQQNQG